MVGRPLLLVALFLAAGWSGCLGADDAPGPRLAQPTNELPPVSSTPATPTNAGPIVVLNYSDAGYVMLDEWTVGDSWYYVSTESSPWYQAYRVVAKKATEERVEYTVELSVGTPGNAPKSRSTITINGTDWSRESTTGLLGTTTTYTPPAQDVRFLRNGSFAYNASGVDERGKPWASAFRTNSYYAGLAEVRLAWGGTTIAGRVEHRELRSDDEGDHRTLTVRYYDRRFLNWIYSEIEVNGVKTAYILEGVRVGGQVSGNLVEY